MTQATHVFKLAGAEQRALRRRLDEGSFEFRRVPHAVFSARGEGVTATLYRSGKLVVQGGGSDGFLARFLPGEEVAASPREDAASVKIPEAGLVGSDECGKGDYFGPLVVAAVRLDPATAEAMAQGEVCDSKRLSDERALRLGAALRATVPWAVRRLDPPAYNAARERTGNVNVMLAELHAEAIGELAGEGMHVLVDRFASDESLVASRLAGRGLSIEQRPRAEANLAVAAASIIAREAFLIALGELSEEHGVDLRKGAGTPADLAGVEFARLHGVAALGEVAKLHFKNTGKVEGRLV
ncbi:MAG: ribonuclease HIII [Planctomycetota bacterium]|nr:ribonuclease HIII [Planctomycetota bacterium]MDP6762680.1 ribonuclease HIII [Planctomycetota bacterium]MDP6989989.1 ribonuclease HIII [Planctomycetota bacterium]